MAFDHRPVRLPHGVRDFLPRAAAQRRHIAETLLELFALWGYERLITPVFECADVLERGLGDDARATALRFVEPGSGDVVALRPDFTPQVARIAATRFADVRGPLRFCYEGAVNRITSPGHGALSQREILQAGVEFIGACGGGADAEALGLAAAAMAATGLPAQIDIGHVGPIRAVLESIESDESRQQLARALAKKAKAEVARIEIAELGQEGLASQLCGLWGPADVVLQRAGGLSWPSGVADELGQLESTLQRVARLAPHVVLTMDLGDLRGFEYYTGLRFAGFARGVGDAVLRGGRYDRLLGRYGQPTGAVGFAVDIEAIAQAQHAAEVGVEQLRLGVLIVGADAERSARLAQALRIVGIRASVHCGDGAAAHADYARQVGFTHLLQMDRAELYEVHRADPLAVEPRTIESAIDGDTAPLRALFS